MLTIAKLFGKSPFAPLQTHMSKVADCVAQLPELFEAISKKDYKAISSLHKKISTLEHEADITKNDIRNHLPKSLFLPIDRSQLLEILSLQDSLADKAEDIATLATLGKLDHLEENETFSLFCKKNVETFQLVYLVVKELDELLESSFGGVEAEKVKEMIEQIAYQEHQLDLLQYDLLKELYALSEKISYGMFHLWMSIVKEIGTLSNLSEKLANRIRMILEMPYGT